MYNQDTDLLFPPRVIPQLRDLRGETWCTLIDQIIQVEPQDLERLAFVLMMIRLGGCISCQSDSFRAMQGCTQCASQTVRRFRGSDSDLLKQFEEARLEVSRYLGKETT